MISNSDEYCSKMFHIKARQGSTDQTAFWVNGQGYI